MNVKKTVSLVTVFALILLGFAASAQDCSQVVVDQAKSFGSQIDEVERAAQKAAAQGATVRVRTLPDLGRAPNIDYAKKNLVMECPAWQAPDSAPGTVQRSVVLMVFVPPRGKSNPLLGIYAGGQWSTSALDDKTLSIIRSDYMAPHIRSKDISGAFVSGLNQVAEHLETFNHPASLTTITHDEKPQDLSKLWLLLIFIAVFAAVLLTLNWILRARRQQLQDKLKRSKTQQQAAIAKADAARLVVELSTDFPSFKILAEPERPDDVSKADCLYQTAQELFRRLGEGSTTDPERKDLDAGQYEAIAQEYQRVVTDLEQVKLIMANKHAENNVRTESATPGSGFSGGQEDHDSHSRPAAATASGFTANREQQGLIQQEIPSVSAGRPVPDQSSHTTYIDNRTYTERDEPFFYPVTPVVIERERSVYRDGLDTNYRNTEYREPPVIAEQESSSSGEINRAEASASGEIGEKEAEASASGEISTSY